jgi:hypothetical protein
MLRPPARQPPAIQITYAQPQHDLVDRLQRILQQALAQGLGAPQQRQPTVLARATTALPPPTLALRVTTTTVPGLPPGGPITVPRPAPLQGPLLLTAAGLREEARRAAQLHPRLTRQLIHQRAVAGVPTTLAAVEAANVVHETALLVVLLPPYALATVCGTTIDRIFQASPQQVMDHLMRHTRRRWVASTISGARCAYVRLLLWLEAQIANENTLHSERHFLPHAAEARGEPPEEAVELGRWSGSTAQDADLEPTVRAARCHRLRVGTLPDRYAQAAKVGRVLGIISRQMDAIRKTIWSRWDVLPWTGGWQLLAAPTSPT